MSKPIITQSLRVDLRFYADGKIEWEWMEPDGRKSPAQIAKRAKWRRRGGGEMGNATWDTFQKLEYHGMIGADSTLGPIWTLFGYVKGALCRIENKRLLRANKEEPQP